MWHFSDVLRQSSDVRCWRVNRPKSAAPEGRGHGLEVCILFPSAVTYFEINSG